MCDGLVYLSQHYFQKWNDMMKKKCRNYDLLKRNIKQSDVFPNISLDSFNLSQPQRVIDGSVGSNFINEIGNSIYQIFSEQSSTVANEIFTEIEFGDNENE